MSQNLVFQDVTALCIALRAYFEAHPLADPEHNVQAVEHLQVLPGTEPPYVIIYDYGAVNIEAFKNRIVAIDTQYLIEAIAANTEMFSAQEQCQAILDGVFATLHGKPIPIEGFATLNLRQGPKGNTDWETIDDQNQFLHAGRRYLGQLAPKP